MGRTVVELQSAGLVPQTVHHIQLWLRSSIEDNKSPDPCMQLAVWSATEQDLLSRAAEYPFCQRLLCYCGCSHRSHCELQLQARLAFEGFQTFTK